MGHLCAGLFVDAGVGTFKMHNTFPKRSPHAATPPVTGDHDPDADGLYDALCATGMSAPEALRFIGIQNPIEAMRLFDAMWDDLMATRPNGNGVTVLDFRCQDWITGLPEGKTVAPATILDLSLCAGFMTLPRSLHLESYSTLKLEGTSWDMKIPRPCNDSVFALAPTSRITFGHVGCPRTLEAEDWMEL